MLIRFTIPLAPKPSNKRRAFVVGGHARVVQDKEVASHQASIALLCAQHRPPAPFDGPVAVEVICLLPRPKLPKKAGPFRLPHAKKPDADNLAKSVLDGLQKCGGWWRDDSQVQRLVVEKWIAAEGEQPHYYVLVEAVRHA